MLFDTAFIADPLNTLQQARAVGGNYIEEAERRIYRLSPEMAIRVLTAHPEILQDRKEAASLLYFHLFYRWQEDDTEGCRQTLLTVPDELLRAKWLEELDSQMGQRSGGGP
jgi:hypothetical protein